MVSWAFKLSVNLRSTKNFLKGPEIYWKKVIRK